MRTSVSVSFEIVVVELVSSSKWGDIFLVEIGFCDAEMETGSGTLLGEAIGEVVDWVAPRSP